MSLVASECDLVQIKRQNKFLFFSYTKKKEVSGDDEQKVFSVYAVQFNSV